MIYILHYCYLFTDVLEFCGVFVHLEFLVYFYCAQLWWWRLFRLFRGRLLWFLLHGYWWGLAPDWRQNCLSCLCLFPLDYQTHICFVLLMLLLITSSSNLYTTSLSFIFNTRLSSFILVFNCILNFNIAQKHTCPIFIFWSPKTKRLRKINGSCYPFIFLFLR